MDNNIKEKLEKLIAKRSVQLEEIRPFISLKTYNTLTEKLEEEKAQIHGGIEAKEQEQRKKEKPQAMPKPFFEQRFLPKKPIRID